MKAGEKWIIQEKCRAIQSHNSYFRIEVLYCSDKFITYKFLASNGEVTMPLSKFEDSYSYCELINEPPQEQPKSCEGCEQEPLQSKLTCYTCRYEEIEQHRKPCNTCNDFSNYQPKEK